MSNTSTAGNLHTTQLIEFSVAVEHDLALPGLFLKLVLELEGLIKIKWRCLKTPVCMCVHVCASVRVCHVMETPRLLPRDRLDTEAKNSPGCITTREGPGGCVGARGKTGGK